jgi:hypothetical protein
MAQNSSDEHLRSDILLLLPMELRPYLHRFSPSSLVCTRLSFTLTIDIIDDEILFAIDLSSSNLHYDVELGPILSISATL